MTKTRFKKLIEGIQDFEKIRILKEQFLKEGDEGNLRELNKILATFTLENLETIPAEDIVRKGKAMTNGF